MTPRNLLATVGLFVFVAQAASGQESASAENLEMAVQRQTASRDALQAQAAEARAALLKWYGTALDAVKKDATSKGDLDGVIATDKERERMDRNLTAEEKSQLSATLRAVRGQYDQARAQQAAQHNARVAASLRSYSTTLEGLEKILTRKGDIEGAIAVRKERAKLVEAPAPVADPAAQKVASAPPPADAPVAPVSPDAPKDSPALLVASELKAWEKSKSPAPGVVDISMPNGEGSPREMRGGTGALIKNELTTGRGGSTWSFEYTRHGTASGVQIIHPQGHGEVLVDLQKDGLGFGTQTSWIKVGWSGHETKRIKLTKEGSEVFPLQDKQKYEIISRLSLTGEYSMTINGKVVATAQVFTAKPLSIKGWGKDENVFKATENYAGILVGPVGDSGGSNAARNLKFQSELAKQ